MPAKIEPGGTIAPSDHSLTPTPINPESSDHNHSHDHTISDKPEPPSMVSPHEEAAATKDEETGPEPEEANNSPVLGGYRLFAVAIGICFGELMISLDISILGTVGAVLSAPPPPQSGQTTPELLTNPCLLRNRPSHPSWPTYTTMPPILPGILPHSR